MLQIQEIMGLHYLPSAVQFRFGGVKGVLTLDTRLERGIKMRKSQVKYNSQHNVLEVIGANYARYQCAFLNKQLVTILSSRGVPEEKFFELQNHAVFKLNKAVDGTIPEVLDNVFNFLRGTNFMSWFCLFLFLLMFC
jgi:RNA-dependent RNA polymerase